MNLKNKHIMITGAAGGLGRSIAQGLAKKSVRLSLLDCNLEALKETAALCQDIGAETYIIGADITNETEIIQAVQSAKQHLGDFAGLINNAGILRDGLLVKYKNNEMTKMTLKDWQAVIDVNLTGTFLCAREVVGTMIKANSKGAIINISSIARAGHFGQSNYAATKAGVAALTVTWAQELAKHNIRCAAIAPGMIQTAMTEKMKETAKAKLNNLIPLGHMGYPQDITDSTIFILEHDYINGRIIEIDGGLRL